MNADNAMDAISFVVLLPVVVVCFIGILLGFLAERYAKNVKSPVAIIALVFVGCVVMVAGIVVAVKWLISLVPIGAKYGKYAFFPLGLLLVVGLMRLAKYFEQRHNRGEPN